MKQLFGFDSSGRVQYLKATEMDQFRDYTSKFQNSRYVLLDRIEFFPVMSSELKDLLREWLEIMEYEGIEQLKQLEKLEKRVGALEARYRSKVSQVK
jgi:hypothetical protein